MKINLQNRKRRELVDHIGEILETIPRYLGVQTCDYQIGNCILERDGMLIISNSIDAIALLNHLKEYAERIEKQTQTTLQFLFQEIHRLMRN